MTSLVTKYAAKKFLGAQMKKHQDKKPVGDDDPYFTYVPHPRNPNKKKKVKRQIPDYIPEQDAIVLAKVRQRAYYLDNSLFEIGGVRFGWGSLIGLVPAVGDALDLLFALGVVYTCRGVAGTSDENSKLCGGLPMGVFLSMLFNCAVDFLIGLVPLIGDFADAAFRCNTKNVRLLEKHLDQKYKPQGLRDAHKSIPKDMRPPPATEIVEFSDDEERLPRSRQEAADIQRPEQARYADGHRDDRGERLNGGSRRERRDEYEYRAPEDPSRKKSTRSTRR